MGAAESNPVRNLDKREHRRTHRKSFRDAIARYREGFVESADDENDGDSNAGNARGGGTASKGPLGVFVRVRPIFKRELKKEFDVITAGERSVVVHDARMHADCRHMLLDHHRFAFDRVFGPRCGNDAVYAATAAPLVADVAATPGAFATVLMYGQTGSGKTYTMSAIYERAARDLFAALAAKGGRSTAVSLSFLELSGKKAADILNEAHQARAALRYCLYARRRGSSQVRARKCVGV